MRLSSNLFSTFFGMFLLSAPLSAHIWILDINDTITIRNDVDPQKTTDVVQRQLVSQNTFLKERPGVSLEAYIKETIKDKGEQRKTYGNLFDYAGELYNLGLISEASLLAMPQLLNTYKAALDTANLAHNSGFFPSLFKFIDYILKIDPEACISIQSFGDEIPLILKVLNMRFSDKLKILDEIGVFNDQNKLVYQGKVYDTPEAMRSLLNPRTVVGWKPNYQAGGGKCLFISKDLLSFFFDDNADRFAKVFLDDQELSKEEGYAQAKDLIFQVNTAKALTDENYFIRLHKDYEAKKRAE